MIESSNRIWYLLSRMLSSEATEDEQHELFSILRKDYSLQQQYEILKFLWSEKKLLPPLQENYESRVLHIIEKAGLEKETEEKQKQKNYRHKAFKVLWVAACLSIVIAGVYWVEIQKGTVSSQTKKEVMVTQKGNRMKIVLPDGSNVWLNAGSKLFYEKKFQGSSRMVRLEGEAYFDVVKDAHRPFIVQTDSIDIQVLGTSFNVKAYPADKTIEATLIKGIIQVRRRGSNAKEAIILHPHEKLTIEKRAAENPAAVSNEIKKELLAPIKMPASITHLDTALSVENQVETAWLYNRLAFRDESFEELALQLERWYNVKIIFEDEAVKQLHFNGSFENETIEQAFIALQTAAPFNFKIQQNEIFISSPK